MSERDMSGALSRIVLHEHGTMALPDVAVRVNALHGEIDGALRLSLQKAIEIGGLLTEAKRQTGHGAFGEWLSDNVAFTSRTARRYMALHENQERLLKADSVSDLGSAYRLLVAHGTKATEAEALPLLTSVDIAKYDLACAETESTLAVFRQILDKPDVTIPELKALIDRASAIEIEWAERRVRAERNLGGILNAMTPEERQAFCHE